MSRPSPQKQSQSLKGKRTKTGAQVDNRPKQQPMPGATQRFKKAKGGYLGYVHTTASYTFPASCGQGRACAFRFGSESFVQVRVAGHAVACEPDQS